MLKELESSHDLSEKKTAKRMKESVKEAAVNSNMQLSFFQLNDPVLEQIREELVSIDINSLTPVEALLKLNEIKKLTGG
jgi:DNA mismatch repair protein MutS